MVAVSAKFGIRKTDEYSSGTYLGLRLQLPLALSSLIDQATGYQAYAMLLQCSL